MNLAAPPVTAGDRLARSAKGAIDFVGAALLLVLLAPMLALIGCLVAVTSRGPVLHRRGVLGMHGRPVEALKFRTMIENADQWLAEQPHLHEDYAANVKLRNDPRVTPLGRWLRRTSLDELPQLLNVLRGEMSLVGPRMIVPEELSKYGDFAPVRLAVKPGLTGLWQVSGRQELPYSERVALDARYIEDWSLWLDLRILLKTVPAVLSMRGAY